MDSTEYPSLGRLAVYNAELAIYNRRVEAAVDAHLDEVERLFRAVAQRDWDAVLRLTEQLVSQPNDHPDKAVVRSARKVCDALRRDPTGAKAERGLGELLTACRATKLKR
jgi:hypothetical protein